MWYLTKALMMVGNLSWLGIVTDVHVYKTYDECHTEQLKQVNENMDFVLEGTFIAVCSQQKLGS
jgi:hypothetical protein